LQSRKLHIEERNDLYCSPNAVLVIKWRRMDGACSAYGRKERLIQNLVEITEEKTTWETQALMRV